MYFTKRPAHARRNSGSDALSQFDRRERDDMRGLDLRGVDLSGRSFGHIDFRGSNLEGATLKNTYLEGANLSGVNLKGAKLYNTDLWGADLSDADLSKVSGYEVVLNTARLKGANLASAVLRDSNLSGADFTGAKLKEADLDGAEGGGAIFHKALLWGTDISGSDFPGALFTGASLADANAAGSTFKGADFTDAIITGSNLSRCDFERANFKGAWLSDSQLEGAKLRSAKLAGAEVSSNTSDYTTEWPKGMAPGMPEEHFRIKKPTSEAFRRWFGASKVVDKKGLPLVVYHATASGGFTAFRQGDTGIYFTDNLGLVSTYLFHPLERTDDPLRHAGKKFPGIFRSFLRIENPFVIDAAGSDWDGIVDSRLPKHVHTTSDIAIYARGLGHDGMIVKRVLDPGTLSDYGAELSSTIYVVFDPRQIKSAVANDGNYDPTNPDMRKNPKGLRKGSAFRALRPHVR